MRLTGRSLTGKRLKEAGVSEASKETNQTCNRRHYPLVYRTPPQTEALKCVVR